MKNKYALSVVIPAYNEAERLPRTLEKIGQFLSGFIKKSEVIVVDDGSNDQTVAKVEALIADYPLPLKIIRQPQNQGKGAAVKKGIEASEGDFILLMDADSSTDISQLPALWSKRGAAIIIGSRYIRAGSIKRRQSLTRRLISRLGNWLIRTLTGLSLADTQNGFKLLAGSSARQIFQRVTIERWGFDIEALVIAQENRIPLLEVPVSWYDDKRSKIRAGRDAWRTFQELLKIVGNRRRGLYQFK